MGVKNFYSDYKSCIKECLCSEMKGGIYSVDFTYQLYRIMIGIKNKKRSHETKIHDYIDMNLLDPNKDKEIDELIDYEDRVAHIIATCVFIETCIEKNIFTILVFDGKPPDIKHRKLDERKKISKLAQKECSKIDNKTSDDYIKQHKKTVRLRDIHYKETTELIKAMGLPEVQAPGEAESQCAAIALCLPEVEGVITEDSDTLLFGSPKIIKKLSRKSITVNELRLSDILEYLKNKANIILYNNSRSEIKEFKEEWLIDIRILCGTDYNDPLTYYDSYKIFELFVLNDFDVSRLLKNESLIEWKNVRRYYLEANVIDPLKINISLDKPNYGKMLEILHKNNKFKIHVVNKLYNGLMYMYNLFYKLSNPYNNLRIYKNNTSYKKNRHVTKYYCNNNQEKVRRIVKYITIQDPGNIKEQIIAY